ncbi:MAG: YigZ family protein [Saprospiraceae bacterium]|nr:YigZ family protein [Saprospiraceae bacterium]
MSLSIIDQYLTLPGPSKGLYKEKGSKFISYACPVISWDEANQQIDQVRKDHPKARHHCFAYRLGAEGLDYRTYDDGEPSGTAGRPILGQIDSYGLSDVLVVVSRYFGGKLLGAAGLAVAYKLSAASALQQSRPVIKKLKAFFQVEFEYEVMGTLMQSLATHQASVYSQNFSAKPQLVFSLPLSFDEMDLDKIIASTLGCYTEEINGRRHMTNLSIKRLPTKPPD